jgi:hypothetical protein
LNRKHESGIVRPPIRRQSMRRATIFIVGAAAAFAACGPVSAPSAAARVRGTAFGSVPPLNVKQSCKDAQKFSSGDANDATFKGCMQDENNAKDQLAKRWSSFKPKDRQDCVEQGRDPSPSYVEVLTCLEMDSDAMKNAPKVDGKAVPQIGGPVAPGLAPGGH